eukprot:m.225061 g.225061  ORF g.225061 m.225061 type:complete len:325 (+) comp11205_c0_seq1:198-1172(+)
MTASTTLSRASASRVYYRGYVHVEQFAGCVTMEQAREVHKMFRRANIRRTRDIHPLFARGTQEPLAVQLFPDRLEARAHSTVDSPSTAIVLDAHLNKVLACAISKSKVIVFLYRAGSTRLHCHCFCFQSRSQTEMFSTALGALSVPLLHIVDKGRLRARSLPAIHQSVTPAPEILARHRMSLCSNTMSIGSTLARFSTFLDLSSDEVFDMPNSLATSGASSLAASTTTLNLIPGCVDPDSACETHMDLTLDGLDSTRGSLLLEDCFALETSTDEELVAMYSSPRPSRAASFRPSSAPPTRCAAMAMSAQPAWVVEELVPREFFY